MKKITVFSISCLLSTIAFTAFAQQNNSGIVNYEVTIQRNNNGSGGQNINTNNNEGSDAAPDVFTMQRNFTFNAAGGKLSSPSFGGQQTQSRRGNFNRGGSNNEYVDFANKKYIRAFKREGNDTTFYISQDMRTATNFQTSDKTKKIAGYTCHKATAQLRNATYTIWYTTDIPENFSPVDGLIPPDGGFVLALESDRMEYKATKVQLQSVSDNDVQIQGPSVQLTQDQIRDMRRQMFERRRNGGGQQQ
jgi:GLPGLI family protein